MKINDYIDAFVAIKDIHYGHDFILKGAIFWNFNRGSTTLYAYPPNLCKRYNRHREVVSFYPIYSKNILGEYIDSFKIYESFDKQSLKKKALRAYTCGGPDSFSR